MAILLIALCLIGAPLFSVIAASAMLGYHGEGIDLMALAIEVIGLSSMPFLSAIPLFTVAGYLLSESKRQKLIDDGVDPANVEMEMIYNTVNNIDDHVSGYISHQSTLDEHYCTFNVRNGTGLSPYKQTKQCP